MHVFNELRVAVPKSWDSSLDSDSRLSINQGRVEQIARGRKIKLGRAKITVYARHKAACEQRTDNSGNVGCDCIRWMQYMVGGKARRESTEAWTWAKAEEVARKKAAQLEKHRQRGHSASEGETPHGRASRGHVAQRARAGAEEQRKAQAYDQETARVVQRQRRSAPLPISGC